MCRSTSLIRNHKKSYLVHKESQRCWDVEGYFAQQKLPALLGTSKDPRHVPTVGSSGVVVSYKRSTPVGRRVHKTSRARNARRMGGAHERTGVPHSQENAQGCLTFTKTHRGTSLTRKRTPLGPYRRPVPRVLWGS